MNRRDFLSMGMCAVAAKTIGDPVPEVDPGAICASDFNAAIELLEKTTVFDEEKRAKALKVVQNHIYAMKSGRHYSEFLQANIAIAPSEVEKIHRDFPPLMWYDRAFDKVLKEMKETVVEGPVPAVWYVYNMGIVVKTRETTFAVDLCHRKASLMVPYLDFIVISHAHGDHYTDKLVNAMTAAQKPVISNFLLIWNWYTKSERTLKIKDVTIRCTEGDHNPMLPGAILISEFNIGNGKDVFTIVHSGDCHNHENITCSVEKPDMYFGHCAIGLSFDKVWQESLHAKLMVPVHHQELGHLGGRWRCVGFHEEPTRILKSLRALGANAVMPVWGDRIVPYMI